MIDALWAGRAVARLESLGHDPAPLVRNLHMDPRALRDRDARIAFRKHVALMERAAAASGDGCFGLHLAIEAGPRGGGVLNYVSLSAATGMEALRTVKRYVRSETDGEDIDVVVEGDVTEVVYRVIDPEVGPTRQKSEFRLARMLVVIGAAIGRRVVPLWVRFDHAEPRDAGDLHRHFQAEIGFRAPHCAIAMPTELLLQPQVTADNALLHILRRYCEDLLEQHAGEDSLQRQVEAVSIRLLPQGAPRIEQVARELGLSPRTLSRRLNDRGLKYSEIVDGLRRGLAARYVADANLRLSEIAYLLGYASISAFSHAYQRWTGRGRPRPTAGRARRSRYGR